MRFSADKTPYQDHQGAVVAVAEGLGYYVQLSADGLMVGGGWHEPRPELVARYRAAVDAEASGGSLARIVADLVASGYEVWGEERKAAPRGFRGDHPRIDLLRRKQLVGSVRYGTPDWLESPEVVDRVRSDWRAFGPLLEWETVHLA